MDASRDPLVQVMFGQEKAAEMEAEYRATKPQNVEMPTVPLIDLSTKDIPGIKNALPQTGKTLRKDAILRARNRLGLDQREAAYIPASNVTRDGNEYVLKITNAFLKKMLNPADGSDPSVESIAVMDNLERIANNGAYFDSKGDREARPQIPGWDHLNTTVYIDGVPYSVDMRVKLVEEKPGNGIDNVLYYYSPEEILKIEKVGPDAPAERHAPSVMVEPEPTSDASIHVAERGVKPQFTQERDALIQAMPGQGEITQDGQKTGGPEQSQSAALAESFIQIYNTTLNGRRLSEAAARLRPQPCHHTLCGPLGSKGVLRERGPLPARRTTKPYWRKARRTTTSGGDPSPAKLCLPLSAEAMERTKETVDIDPDAVYHRFKTTEDSEVAQMKWDGLIDPDMDGYHETMKQLSRELKFYYERKKRK